MKLEYKCENFCTNIHKLWQADKHCDVVLIGADGKIRIRAHRLVLEAAIPVFENQIPDTAGNIQQIVVTAIDGVILQQLVGMCYSGSLDVNKNNVSSVYIGAIHLRLNALLPTLDNYIMTLLNNSNCLHFHKLAETFSRSVLFAATEKYICSHFTEICDQPNFLELDIGYLNKLLALAELEVPSAEDLFNNLMKWIHHTPDGLRDIVLAKLLPNLKLSLMSPEFLLEYVNPLCKTAETKNLVTVALVQNSDADMPEPFEKVSDREQLIERNELMTVAVINNSQPISPVPVERKRERLLVIAGIDNVTHEIMEYSYEYETWNTIAMVPVEVVNYAVVHSMTLKSLYFVISTLNDSELKDYLLFKLQTNKFTMMVNLPGPISSAGDDGNACNTDYNDADDNDIDDSDEDDNLIVVTGWDDRETLSTVERWPYNSTKWHPFEFLKLSSYCARLVRVGKLMYCIGGHNAEDKSATVECYNMIEDRWSTIAPLHHARSLCGVLYDEGKLYVIGGYSNVIECYNPIQNEWTEVCIVEGSEGVSSCVHHNNRIVAFGQNIVLQTDSGWKIGWKICTIAAINAIILAAFSVPMEE